MVESNTIFDIEKIEADRKVVSKIQETFKELSQSRNAYELTWFQNMAFVLGHQYLSYSDTFNRFYEPPAPAHRRRIVHNLCQPYIGTMTSKLATRPVPKAIPGSNEGRDIEAAGIADIALQYYWEKEMADKLPLHIKNAGIYATSFAVVYWDRLAKEGIGDVAVDITTPFEWYADPSITDIKDQNRIMRVRSVEIEDIKKAYSEFADKIKPQDTTTSNQRAYYENAIANININSNSIASKVVDDKRKCVMFEYWERPTVDYPKGRYVMVVNDVLIKDTKLPYPDFFIIPLIQGQYSGRFYSQAVLELLIPIQKEINNVLSKIAEAKDMMCNPKWYVRKGSGIAKNDITDAPGEIIEGNFEPVQMAIAPLPQYVFNYLDRLFRDFYELSGQYETSGQTPQGLTSGLAIRYWAEIVEKRMVEFSQNIDNSIIKISEAIIYLMKKYYNEKRILKVVGDDNRLQVVDFEGADLKDTTDVRIAVSASVPQSGLAREQYVYTLLQTGLLGDPMQPLTKHKALKLLGIRNHPDIWEETEIDIRKAKEENEMILDGELPPPAKEYEEHIIHIDTHSMLIRSGTCTEKQMELTRIHSDTHKQFIIPAMQMQTPPQSIPTPEVSQPPQPTSEEQLMGGLENV